jgi:hypothetical protein
MYYERIMQDCRSKFPDIRLQLWQFWIKERTCSWKYLLPEALQLRKWRHLWRKKKLSVSYGSLNTTCETCATTLSAPLWHPFRVVEYATFNCIGLSSLLQFWMGFSTAVRHLFMFTDDVFMRRTVYINIKQQHKNDLKQNQKISPSRNNHP